VFQLASKVHLSELLQKSVALMVLNKMPKVIISQGVKCVAEVTITNFDNKCHFVTFNPEFGHLI
jgi:hypothetical protein